MTSLHRAPAPCRWFARLAAALDKRPAPGLALLSLGAVIACGRRAVAGWIRAAGLSEPSRSAPATRPSPRPAGRKAEALAADLVLWVVKPPVSGAERLALAIDDTPTRRYGPHVEGAGVHHNPTPGPAGSPFVYGHVLVVLGPLAVHPAWGVIALPLLSRLYARKKDLPGIDPKHGPEFRTKPELAVELLRWAELRLGLPGEPLRVAAGRGLCQGGVPQAGDRPGDDGGQPVAVRRLLGAAAAGVIPPGRKGPGRPPARLRHRAGQPGRAGRAAAGMDLRGVHPVRGAGGQAAQGVPGDPAAGRGRDPGGAGDEPTGWRAYSCADPSAGVADILETVANRFSWEITFRDCEVVGAGRQQVRSLWSSVGAFHLCLWTSTMTEAWARSRSASELVDRSDSPRDSPLRRPSHADKRRAWRRALLGEEIRAVLRPGVTREEIQAMAGRPLGMAA